MANTRNISENAYSNTRCFIDCDGTIVNSLKYYNIIIDQLFLDKLADKEYSEYYKEFGDAYEIIPGAPWKTILSYLIDYLARRGGKLDNKPVDHVNNVAFAEATIRVAFDTLPVSSSNIEDGSVLFLESGNASYALMPSNISERAMIAALDTMPDAILKRVVFYNVGDKDVSATNEKYNRVPSFIDEVMNVDSVIDVLVERFENGFVELVSNAPVNDLAIAPIVEFCREYKAGGGTLIIHSGTNKVIAEAMLEHIGIMDLFADKLCTDMLNMNGPSTDSPWGYKIDLLGKLIDKYPVNGTKDFVIGDTKGDAFGAHEFGLPFVLVWRGYPKDPSTLHGDNGIHMAPDIYCDFRPELLAACNEPSAYRDDIDRLLSFAASL